MIIQIQRLTVVHLPWALRAGGSCADLMTIEYEEHLHEDVESLRLAWNIEPAPPMED
jgi:ubiquinone biosynthesis protein Coq4